jgi:hypothetical protein
MTFSMEILGATHGFLEYGRVNLAAPVGIGAQAAAEAASAPAPSDFKTSRRRFLLSVVIDSAPPNKSAAQSVVGFRPNDN